MKASMCDMIAKLILSHVDESSNEGQKTYVEKRLQNSSATAAPKSRSKQV